MEFVQYLTPTHQEIMEVLNQANIIVIEQHKSCGNKDKWDGWTLTAKDKRNDQGKTILTICTYTTKKVYEDWRSEINRTLAHESVHVAQECKGRPLGITKMYLSSDKMTDVMNSVKGYNPRGKVIEMEAYFLEDNPEQTLYYLKKFCF